LKKRLVVGAIGGSLWEAGIFYLNRFLKVTELYPRMVQPEDTYFLMNPIMIEEIKNVLNKFQRDKSSGLDGWMVEFFTYFFDLVSDDLV